jgi:hypothetical protein
VDNTQPRFHFVEIPYAAQELSACTGKLRCASAAPAPGTRMFQARVTLKDGRTLETPGIETKELGGLGPAVHRVTVRRDDSYLGYLTELLETPYIFGSSGVGKRHQTDLRIGSDCADLAVYGQRRMGRPVEYTSTWSIEKVAPKVVVAETKSDEGHALDARSLPVAVGAARAQVRPGDLLLFPKTRHVAVLYEDREPLGVLDQGDLMIHTCWAPPVIEPIGATGCSSFPIRVLRFKEPQPAATR